MSARIEPGSINCDECGDVDTLCDTCKAALGLRWDDVDEAHDKALTLDALRSAMGAHLSDAECRPFLDPETDTCRRCHVHHGDPCPECGGCAFHVDGCSKIEGGLS